MKYAEQALVRARKISTGLCPDCDGKLIPSTDIAGCRFRMHYRCPKCGYCWRLDGGARSCRNVEERRR